MPLQCWVDIETFSRANLKSVGDYRYAEDDSTRVLLVGYAFDEDPAKVWDVTTGDSMPADLESALSDKSVKFIAHNSMFDRNVLSRKVDPRFGEIERWRDTMVLAYAASLPGALGVLSTVLGLPPDKAKDKDGRRLVLKFSKPQSKGVIKDRTTDPEDWERFVNYCRLDVEAMREVARRIPSWGARANLWDDWHLDQVINDRGINIDISTVRNAIAVAGELKKDANDHMKEITGGEVKTAGQRDAILNLLRDRYGYDLPNAQKNTFQEFLNRDDICDEARRIVETRLGAAVISIMKYQAMDRMICKDGTVKGTLQFMGASRTGRFAGRGLQLQNFARGVLTKPSEVEQAIDAINTGVLPYVYDDPNKILSSCLRGMLVPPPGKKFVVADLSNIEGRVLAWLSWEQWKLKAFEEFDTLMDVNGNWVHPKDRYSEDRPELARDDKGEFIHKGPDLYKATYARSFGIKPEDVTKKQRQVGKVMELALGYMGGVGAFVTFANLYGVDLDELAEHVRDAVSIADWGDALSSWEWACEKGMTQGLSQNAYTACEVLKRAWRKAHPNVVAFWNLMSRGVTTVLMYGEYFDAGRIKFSPTPGGSGVRMRLPSGRFLTYPCARLPKEGERCDMVFAGTNQKTGKWELAPTHKGVLTENAVQAVARDILMNGIRNAEARGFAVHAHVHDEIIASVPAGSTLNEDDLSECMTRKLEWTRGLPLNAEGFTATRYRKG